MNKTINTFLNVCIAMSSINCIDELDERTLSLSSKLSERQVR